MLHENNVLGLFLYAWGYRDAQAGRPMARLLATPQSFLDHLIGDLMGRSPEGRWFLVEFKRERSGLAKEITTKPARSELLDTLEKNSKLAELSAYAHFACWLEEEITIQQYVMATDDEYFRRGLPENTVFTTNRASFKLLYEHLTEADQEPSPYRPRELYWRGTGVTGDGMYQYLEAVLGAHPNVIVPSDEVNALLGFSSAPGAQITLVPANFEGILGAFERARKVAESAVNSSTTLPNC